MISSIPPWKTALAMIRFVASDGWKASQNTCFSLSGQRVEMRGRQVRTPLNRPTPQHPDLASVKPDHFTGTQRAQKRSVRVKTV
jgi:hypothetical protein